MATGKVNFMRSIFEVLNVIWTVGNWFTVKH